MAVTTCYPLTASWLFQPWRGIYHVGRYAHRTKWLFIWTI